MSHLEPWVIEQLEDEARRRQQDEATRQHRIELPQTGPGSQSEAPSRSGASLRIEIFPISPRINGADVTIIDV